MNYSNRNSMNNLNITMFLQMRELVKRKKIKLMKPIERKSYFQ